MDIETECREQKQTEFIEDMEENHPQERGNADNSENTGKHFFFIIYSRICDKTFAVYVNFFIFICLKAEGEAIILFTSPAF